MERKQWNQVLDHYLTSNDMSCDDYEALDEMQVYTIQEVKKAQKRLNKSKEIKKYV